MDYRGMKKQNHFPLESGGERAALQTLREV